jgi:hypothetical protein
MILGHELKRATRLAAIVGAPLVLAATGAAVAIRFNDSDQHWFAALTGWTVGWLFALIAIAGWERLHGRPVLGRPDAAQPPWQRTEIVLLAVGLSAAALLRTVALESYPIALHNDEMTCLLEARGFLGADTALFDTGWFSCPNFGFFLTSLWIRALGPTLLALRLSSAFLGLLSLLAIYLIVRRLFGVRPALISLILTTPFHWHLHYSRTGFHYMQAASLTALSILFFALALDRRSVVLFGCAGVSSGIAWQTYYAAWLTPAILIAWSLAGMIGDRDHKKSVVVGLVVMLALLAVTLAPLLAHYVERPDAAVSRTNGVFLFSEGNRQHVAKAYETSDPLQLLTIQATLIGGMFIGRTGDTSVQYGLQDQFIDPFLVPVFLLGLGYALTLVRRPGGQLIWIWFLATVIAGGLLTIDAPFSPRLIGITPLVLVFPALLIDRILQIEWIADHRQRLIAATILVAALIAPSAWWNLRTTFDRYPASTSSENRDFIIRLAADLGDVKKVANFTDPQKFDHQAYRALVPEIRGTNLAATAGRVEAYVDVVNAFGPQTLVIYPLGQDQFYGLCDRFAGASGGTVLTRHGLAGFEWCFVE